MRRSAIYYGALLTGLIAEATWAAWLGAWFLVPLIAAGAVGLAFSVGRDVHSDHLDGDDGAGAIRARTRRGDAVRLRSTVDVLVRAGREARLGEVKARRHERPGRNGGQPTEETRRDVEHGTLPVPLACERRG